MLQVSRLLGDSEALRKVLYVVMDIGNFMNDGSFVGNAAGVTVSNACGCI